MIDSIAGMDLTTRQVEAFVRVADELNFTRAAESLYMTQPALSRQVRQLEERLGFALFERTSRKVALTDAGAEFLAGARAALCALEEGIERGRDICRQQQGCLRLGFVIGAALELTPLILEEFRKRRPDVTLEMHEDGADPSAGLAKGTTDVALLRPPLSADDVVFDVLFVEPRVVVVPAEHPLANRAVARFDDVAKLPLIGSSIPDQAFADFWVLNDCRSEGSQPANVVLRMEENLLSMLERVAAGTACMIGEATAGRTFGIPGVRFIPIVDVPGSAVAVAWRSDRSSELVEEFVATARLVRDREVGLIRRMTAMDGVTFGGVVATTTAAQS